MTNVIRLARPPRAPDGAALTAALIDRFATQRRTADDVFWLKENAELLNVLESTGADLADGALAPYADTVAQLPQTLRFFPQYYRFHLSIALDLQALGLGDDRAADMAAWVADHGLVQAELSDLQRAEARRLCARAGIDLPGLAGLDDRLRGFVERSETFAIPNRKAAYELTHILFYLSDYGRRDPALGPRAQDSLIYAGIIAFLEQNADLLAEICIALRFAGHPPPPLWEDWVANQWRSATLGLATGQDQYHDWLMAGWMQAVATGGALPMGPLPDGTGLHIAMPRTTGPLRALSQALHAQGWARVPDYARARRSLLPALSGPEQAILTLAAGATDRFEAFFAHFARV